MKSKSKFALFGVTVAIGLLLPFAQALVSPSTYNALWGFFIAAAAGVIAVSLGLPQLLLGNDRQRLASLRREQPEAVAELVAVWSEGEDPILARMVVDDVGISIESSKAPSQRLAWARVTGLKSVPYGRTIRVGMQIVNDESPFCVMPVSGTTLFAVSSRRADGFFDAIKKEWRASRAGPSSR